MTVHLDTAKRTFDDKGYVLVPGFIPRDTALRLRDISASDDTMLANSQAVLDSEGRQSRLTLWYQPGDDAFGRLSCCQDMLDTMQYLLDGKVSFFHAKLMQKLPKVGGKWEWHQDYGYWYSDGFLSDAMGSCFVALDPCTRENGCLSVIPQSQKYGRLEHGQVGQQTGADDDRVQVLEQRHGRVFCEMQPGDALFFHSNLLHTSAANLSEHSRLGLISCFFRQDNESIKDDPRYRNKHVSSLPTSSILDGPLRMDSGVTFMNAEQ